MFGGSDDEPDYMREYEAYMQGNSEEDSDEDSY
jgi:hypothetical protein